MKCDSCGERHSKLHLVNKENICDECAEEESFLSASFEDGVVNGEPWAIGDSEEDKKLWNPKYKERA